ncbi:recombination protein NinG [Morganella morganii]|uniref:recombination protein NinG n=1 Tax=Morganella morganii TaxID=582 RepID=UPI003EBD724E
MAKQPRRKCLICRAWFHPKYDNIEWCCPEHGLELSQRRREKAAEKALAKLKKERRQQEREAKDKLKIRKLAVKPLSYFAKQAQTAFNAYIRERDKDLPCISCGRHHTGQYHAGHYRTTKAMPELRFDEDNVHKQCSACNNHLSGNIENYRPALIEKIGQDRFDRLMGVHELPKWKREDYERIRDEYRRKLKELKNAT